MSTNLHHIKTPVNLFCLMIVLVMVAVYGILRMGFADNSWLDLLSTAGLSTILLLLPDFLQRFSILREWGYSTTLSTIDLWITLILLSFIPMIAWVFPYMCVVGGAILLINYLRDWREIPGKSIPIIFGIFLATYLIAMLWGGKTHNPLYFEKIALGEAHIDLMYHAGVANLMKTYGFATTGMDGNVYLPYHWASHFVAGRFSNLLNIAPVKFYNFSLYVVFLPLFFKAFLLAAIEVRKYNLLLRSPQPLKGNLPIVPELRVDSPLGAGGESYHKSIGFKPYAFVMDFITVVIIFALFIPLIMRVPGALYGESTLMAATVSMLIFTLLFRYLSSDIPKTSDDSAKNPAPNSSDTLKVSDEAVINKINFTAASLLIGVLALFKISFGFILVCVYAYVFVRKKWYRSLWKIGVFLLSITIFATIYIYNNETGGSANAGFNPRHTLRMVLELLTPKMWLYYSLCLIPLIFLLCKRIFLPLHPLQRGTKAHKKFFAWRKISPFGGGWGEDSLLMELLLLIPILGFIPIALINLKHNSVYFTCFQILFGAMVLIAILPEVSSFIKENLYGKIIGGVALVAILILGGIKYVQILPEPIRQNLTIRKTLLEKENLSEANGQLFTNIPQKNISQNSHYQLIKSITTLNDKPRKYKRNACLWISPTNRKYWDMQHYRKYGAPFVATSLSGISLINGRPTDEFSRYTYYQYPMDETYNAGLEAVKQKAKKKGFSMLIEVREDGELVEHSLVASSE